MEQSVTDRVPRACSLYLRFLGTTLGGEDTCHHAVCFLLYVFGKAIIPASTFHKRLLGDHKD